MISNDASGIFLSCRLFYLHNGWHYTISWANYNSSKDQWIPLWFQLNGHDKENWKIGKSENDSSNDVQLSMGDGMLCKGPPMSMNDNYGS